MRSFAMNVQVSGKIALHEPVKELYQPGVSTGVRDILESVLAGQELNEADAISLFGTEGAELDALTACADQLRRASVGDTVTFVINRNINYTNVCYMGCRFCSFAKRKGDADAEFFDLDDIFSCAAEAWARVATEVCIQGGLHPDIHGHFYQDMLEAIKAKLPDMHIHAFSPYEIWLGA